MFFDYYEEKYRKMGLTDYRLRRLEDLIELYGVDYSIIDGYEKLVTSGCAFRCFLINFYNAWGLEARESIRPISVKYMKDKANGAYLRFDYWMNGEVHWLHLKNETTWY